MRKRIQREEHPPEWPERVLGGKYVRMLQRYTRSLRDEDAHGNRKLFLDDVVIAYLLAFYNPMIRSLRTIEDFSQTRQAQRHLSMRKLCKSTLSDFNRVADPTILEPLIEHLRTTAAGRRSPGFPADLPQSLGKVLAVDGSFFRIAADVVWAIRHRAAVGPTKAGVRLDVHLDIATWIPEVIDVAGRGTSETKHALEHIQPGAIHIYDRGIFSFELLAAQQQAGAFFVHRLREPGRNTPKFAAEQSRSLTPRDHESGVLSDAEGRMAGSMRWPAPDLRLREVVIQSKGELSGEIRLLTNLLDVDAWVIGLLYSFRWQVELFFRWLKCFANFTHLISESRQGVLLSFYVAVIGVLAMYLHTGAKPSKYAFIMLGMAAQGGASLDEIMPILRERERRIALDRASLARRKSKQK
jgi:hypothetical protein